MSSAITQFDKAGKLGWSKSVTGFTGLQVTDKDGNIFALAASSVRKYTSDGTFVDSFAFSFTPNDITFGYDGHVYICGEEGGSGSGSGSGTSDGYIIKLTTALVEVASETISGDPAKQIKADIQGNAYVSCVSFSIRKFSEALSEIWECEYFTSVPKIAITKNGNMYAAGQAESGGWISTNDPSIQSYWSCSANCNYIAETDELGQLGTGLKIGVPWGSEWQNNFKPTKMRVVGTLSPGEVLYEISLGVSASGPPTEIVHETNPPELGIAYDIDWSLAPSDAHEINYVKVYASGWDYTVRVSDIQFYAGVETNGIASISSDGEVTGFIARDTDVQQILVDKSGHLIVHEAGEVINTVGSWIQRFDDSYWRHSYAWTGEVWHDPYQELSLRRVWGEVWPEDPEWVKDFRPTRIRVSGTIYDWAVPNLGDYGTIRLYTTAEGTTSPQTHILDTTDMILTDEGDGFWTIDVAIDWTLNVDERNIYILWLSYSEEVHNIEFYSEVDEYGSIITMIDPSTGDEVWSYEIGMEVNTIITGLYGEVDTNSLAARLEFSADIEIGGNAQQAYVVYPTAKITFSQPTPIIDGHQTNIYPIPGEINLQSNANLMTAVSVTLGAISLNSTPGVIVPVIPEGNIVEFSSPMDTGDIEGYLTILKPTGQMQFGTHPETWVFTTDAPGYGPIILIEPPTVGFASDNIDINQQTVYVSLGEISFSSNAFHLSSEDVLAAGTAEFPSLALDLYAGAFLEPEFPVFEMAGSGTAGHVGRLSFDLPSLSVELNTGGQLEEDFPRLNLEMTAVNNVLAAISVTLPQLGADITASHPSTADLDITLPIFSMALEATIGIVGEMSAQLPKFSMGITALPGATADLEGTFKLLKLTATGGPSGPGEIDATLPTLDLELTSGELTSDVLRYDWERIA